MNHSHTKKIIGSAQITNLNLHKSKYHILPSKGSDFKSLIFWAYSNPIVCEKCICRLEVAFKIQLAEKMDDTDFCLGCLVDL